MGLPLPTYKLPDEQFIALGQPARLFCEAFVGKFEEIRTKNSFEFLVRYLCRSSGRLEGGRKGLRTDIKYLRFDF